MEPESFDGGTGWKDWSIAFDAVRLLALHRWDRSWNGRRDRPTLCSTQPFLKQRSRVPRSYMLVMLCKGTALTRGVNAGAQEGVEAWRALVLHYEPTSLTRNAGLLQELLNFSFEGEIAERMVQFDRDIDHHAKASGENIPNNIRICVALRMLPDGPLKHLVLNSARLTTWETLKAEIDNVRRAQAAASSTPQAMDLSACGTQGLDAILKGNPKSRGKGKDKSKPKDDIPMRGHVTVQVCFLGPCRSVTVMIIGRLQVHVCVQSSWEVC